MMSTERSLLTSRVTRMELSKKVKITLDETRMLILGAQILLGFQFRGVFSNGYGQLPNHSRYLDGVALGLMVCVVGLLVTPGPYHRIVEAGEDSGNFHRLVTVIADLALLPFALALGLDLFITAGRVFGEMAGAAAGTAATAMAVAFWYGSPDCESDTSGEEERAVTRQAPADWSEIRWCTNDLKALERAQEKFGVLPSYAPALSPCSAASHSAIPGLASMRLSESRRRPRGRRQ